jgi:putative addiction module antidote
MYPLKVRAVGSSSGVVLPKELLAQLGVKQGDVVYATRAADGAFRLTPFDDAFEKQMSVAEAVMREDRDILRALAKR